MFERVPRTRLERHGGRRAAAQAHVEEYFGPEPQEIPEPIKPSKWGKLTKYAVWEDFLEVRQAAELQTPSALAEAYYEKYISLEDLFEIALQQLTGDILDPSVRISEEVNSSEREEAYLAAAYISREALQEFLEREEFWILQRPALFARMRSALLKAGEIDLLERYFKKSGIKEFTPEDGLCAFTEHIHRWVSGGGRDVQRLTIELTRLAERLHVRIDWQGPKMQEAAKEVFQAICEKFCFFEYSYLAEFQYFIEHTGIDPLYWRPPYDGLLEKVHALVPSLISTGNLTFADELQKTIKGWRLEDAEQQRLLRGAYNDLFKLYFWSEELERPLAEIEQENKEKYESFLAHGGRDIPKQELIDRAVEALKDAIRNVKDEDRVEAFVLFEAHIVRAIHVFHIPIEEFQGRLKESLEKLFVHERYSRPYFYQERMVIMNRLEKITGVKTPIPAEHEKRQLVIEAIERLRVPYVEKHARLKPYLDALLPGLIIPMSFDRFQRAARQGLERVSRDDLERLDFIEHYQAFKSWHIADTCGKQEKYDWIKTKVEAEGLLFDPQEAAFQLDCTPLPFEKQLGKNWHLDQDQMDEQHKEKVFAEQVARAVSESGLKEALEILLTQNTTPEFKERILKNLIHTVDLPALLIQGHVRPPRQREHEIVSLLEAIERLSVSAERKNALAQEIYATYVVRTNNFPDIQLIPGAPAIDRSHPVIKRAREMATKACVCDYGDRLNQVVRNQLGVALKLSRSPAFLPADEWSDELIQEVSKNIHPEFLADLKDPEKKKSFAETQEQFEAKLLAEFDNQLVSEKADQTEQYLLLFPDKIEIACNTNPLFYKKYRLWVAALVGDGRWAFDAFERRPGLKKQFLSGEESAIILKRAINAGFWQTVDALVEHNPAETTHMKEGREALISLSLPDKALYGDTAWLFYVMRTYPEYIRKVAAHLPKFKQDYLAWVKKAYKRDGALLPEFLRTAPEVDLDDAEFQYMFAERAVLLCITSSGLVEDAGIVRWQDPALKQSIAPEIKKYFPAHTAFHQSTVPIESQLMRVERMLKMTGYQVTDPAFWSLKSQSLSAILAGIKQWQVLEARYGGSAQHRSVVWAEAQEAIDERCMSGVESLTDFLTVQKQIGLQPSEEAIRARVLSGLEPFGDINKGIEVAKAFHCTIELTPEQIEKIEPKSARTEALIYTILLPQGAKRAHAEQVFKARSPLAALIPQLLAIQSPTRRPDFCPYAQELQPLLDRLAINLGQDSSSKSLLFFLKEFGMRNLPRLASAIMALHEFPVTKQWYGRMDMVVELRELVGVPDNEEWRVERYIERIREIAQEVRQSILEDRPLEAAIERSALGMEIFNAIIPHTGNYQDVRDRPQLVAAVRQNREKLHVEPWYQPSTRAVNMAEQEKSLTGDNALSPTDRAIRVRREQIEKKFQDETMQRFISLWESSARVMDLEPTGQSRAYWFSLLKDRWEKQQQALEKKREGIENPRGIAALTKQIERLEQSQARIMELMLKDQEEGSSSPEILLEELQSLFVNSSGKIDRVELEAQAGDVARALSLVLMRGHSEAHYLAIKQSRSATASEGGLLSPTQISAWETWFREEYLEHFAGLNGDADVVLSQTTRILLQKLWRIDGLAEDIQKKKANEKEGPIQHPIMGCFEQIKALQQQIQRLEREENAQDQKPLEFWPVKGIGRVLAGDIADACYHKHRHTLAQGGERKITALLMTIPGETALAGSTLLIDTRTLSHKRVLVIRALNPTVAILRKSLDAKSVVEATIDYAKEVAQATTKSADPITEIRICYDRSSGHSTNRPEIFAAETQLATQYKWGTGDALENVTETNFNGYDIHDPRQTRVVWRVKRP